MRNIHCIVVHCTATPQKTTTVEKLRTHWKQIGWNAPGYHYIVMPNGNIEQLLEEDGIANGVRGYNKTTLHVAYVGGVDDNGRPTDNRSEQQKAALYFLLERLKCKYPHADIKGHRDFSPDLNGDGVISQDEFIKQCPCFDAAKEYEGI